MQSKQEKSSFLSTNFLWWVKTAYYDGNEPEQIIRELEKEKNLKSYTDIMMYIEEPNTLPDFGNWRW